MNALTFIGADIARSRTGMTPARWAYLKSLRPGSGRYLHVSAEIVRNPLAVIAEAQNKLFTGPQYIVGATHTYNVGRNKAKRVRRELMGVRK